MRPLSAFGQTVPYAALRKSAAKFGQNSHSAGRDIDALCESIAQASPTSLKDLIATTLEETARYGNDEGVRQIEVTIMDWVDGLEHAGVPPVGFIRQIQEGLRQTSRYMPSSTPPDEKHPPFLHWLMNKERQYGRELDALKGPDEWTRDCINDTFNR